MHTVVNFAVILCAIAMTVLIAFMFIFLSLKRERVFCILTVHSLSCLLTISEISLKC